MLEAVIMTMIMRVWHENPQSRIEPLRYCVAYVVTCPMQAGPKTTVKVELLSQSGKPLAFHGWRTDDPYKTLFVDRQKLQPTEQRYVKHSITIRPGQPKPVKARVTHREKVVTFDISRRPRFDWWMGRSAKREGREASSQSP